MFDLVYDLYLVYNVVLKRDFAKPHFDRVTHFTYIHMINGAWPIL